MTRHRPRTCEGNTPDPLGGNRRRGGGATGRAGQRPAGGPRRFTVSPFRRFVVGTAALASCALLAQSPPPPPATPAPAAEVRVLTLEEALRLADAQNPGVRKAGAFGEWVKGKYLEERAAALPQVTLTGDARRDSDETMTALTGGLFPAEQDTQSVQLQVDQLLFAWGKVGAAVRAAEVGFQSAQEESRRAHQSARLEVVRSYYDILLARELEGIARRNLALRERRFAEAQKRFELGTATEYDVLAARVAAENARPALVRTSSAVRQARSRFRMAVGLSEGEVDASGTLAVEPEAAPSHGEAQALALERRPELLAQAHRVQVFREILTIAKAGNKPRLDFSAAYAQKWLSFGPYAVDGPLWNAGLYLKVPVFDGLRTRGQVIEARSDLTVEEIELTRLRDQVALEVSVSVDNVREAAEVLTALSQTADQAERLLEMAEKGLEYGVKTLLEVEDAQVNLTQARGNLAVARRDYLVALSELKRATGTLGE